MRNVDLARSLLKASIPFADTARRMKRRLKPYVPNPIHTGFSFDDGIGLLHALRQIGADLSGDVLEVGSGWTPVVPLLFHLAGARSVTLTDLERLFDETSVPTAMAFVHPRLGGVAQVLGMEVDQLAARLPHFRPAYVCPWRADRHPAASVDIAISRAVMEHVPAREVPELFRELRRIVRPGGLMCHSIDNTDHWQHGDGKGSLVDFLRYPTDSLRWRLSQVNTQGRMNRFRHSDYLALAREAGWEIVSESGRVPPDILRDVLRMKEAGELAPEFADRDPHDLATTATLLIARRGD
ncbi:class I SAM-dependent methyltransferase [Roseococcus pinisoli]|uniref:Class I SAM-dependent methyltransferase n=1 Tax=Roseococcus pinisoli TaxID=2835040 RepID=A0ABS5Q9P4_9PROT|nr:class I SAM-dependent methyltransferase [Roseococcus pinisoli]MBS7809313.1 class I SAM-dependent methyltransferase [Roseococcus pinisoli]